MPSTDKNIDMDLYFDFSAAQLEYDIFTVSHTAQMFFHQDSTSVNRFFRGCSRKLKNYLQSIIPTTARGNPTIDLGAISRLPIQGARFELLMLIVYALSNCLYADDLVNGGLQFNQEYFATICHEANRNILESLLTTQIPTVQALGEQLLLYAVVEDNYDLLKLLLKTGVHPDAGMSVDGRPLILALRSGHEHIAAVLLEYGADPNTADLLTSSPLALAIKKHLVRIIPTLLDLGAEYSGRTPTVLHAAADSDNIDVLNLFLPRDKEQAVKLLHQAGIKDISHPYLEYTPFEFAAYNGRLETVRFIWSLDTELHISNMAQLNSALPILARRGCEDIVQSLLSKGANPNVMTDVSYTCDVLTRDEYFLVATTALDEAAWSNNTVIIESLIESGALTHRKAADKNISGVALYGAAFHGNMELVKLLLAAGVIIHPDRTVTWVDGNSETTYETLFKGTVLQAAVLSGHAGLVQLLLNEVSANEPTLKSIPTALHRAVETGRKDITKLLLQHGASINACSSGEDALMIALRANNDEMVELLLDNGADPKAIYKQDLPIPHHEVTDYASPLSVAIRNSAESMASRLIDLGAGYGDIVALQIAMTRDKSKLVQRLITLNHGLKEFNDKTFAIAVARGDMSLVQQLIRNQVNINHTIHSGNLYIAQPPYFATHASCPISLAAGEGHIGILRFLLELGAVVNNLPTMLPRSSDRQCYFCRYSPPSARQQEKPDDSFEYKCLCPSVMSALSFAQPGQGNATAIAEILINAGAEIDHYGIVRHETDRFMTPLQNAIYYRDSSLVDLLIAKGADINFPAHSHYGRNAIQAAAEAGAIEVVEKLLKHGANVNAEPARERGATALQFAASNGFFRICRRLLEAGADVNAPGSEYFGWTALEGAAYRGRLDIVQLLLHAGADVCGRESKQYRRAVGLSWYAGHRTLAMFLQNYKKEKYGASECQPLEEILHDPTAHPDSLWKESLQSE